MAYKNERGYGSVQGERFSDVLGFEHGTAGFGGNINQRIQTNLGIQSNDPNVLSGFEPFRGGHVISKVLVWPAFFHEKIIKLGQILLEDQFIGFEGVESNSLNTIERQTGSVKRTSTYVTNYVEGNGKFTVKFPEFRGAPGRKFIDYWLHGMSDPKTGHRHFYGKTHLAPTQINAGMVYMTIVTGPSRRPEDIEFASIWTGATPTTELIGETSNGDVGEEGSEIIHSVPFVSVGFDRVSPEVHALARMIVTGLNAYGQSFLDSALPYELYSQYVQKGTSGLREELGGDFRSRLADAQEALSIEDAVQTRDSFRNANGIEADASSLASAIDNVNPLS